MKSYSTAPIDIKQPPLDVLNNVRAALDTVARVNNLGLSFGLSSDPSDTSGLPVDVSSDPSDTSGLSADVHRPFYLVIYDERSNDLLGEPACDVGGPCESCQ